MLQHWCRVEDQEKQYPFARFNKVIEAPSYTDEEYENLLKNPNWTKEETDSLMDLCKRFDLRFEIIMKTL